MFSENQNNTNYTSLSYQGCFLNKIWNVSNDLMWFYNNIMYELVHKICDWWQMRTVNAQVSLISVQSRHVFTAH